MNGLLEVLDRSSLCGWCNWCNAHGARDAGVTGVDLVVRDVELGLGSCREGREVVVLVRSGTVIGVR